MSPRRVGAILRESIASALSQPVASVVAIVMVAGMCATVLLTTGRTVGAEQAVLASIDSEGTRSIVVRADAGSGLDTSVLDRLAALGDVEWAGAFGAATDMRNVAFEDGTRVPVRAVWGPGLSELGLPTTSASPGGLAWASPLALDQLGLTHPVGGIATSDGLSYAVAGRLDAPDHLGFLEPLVLVPQPTERDGTVSVLVVVATGPEVVAPLAETVQSVLAVEDPSQVTVSTNADLATLRGLVETQLGAYGRSLVLAVLALTAVLVAAILYGLVMLRRKDFGRRRALGASQGLIVALLLTQIAVLAALGAVLGSVGAAVALRLGGDPLPGVDYFAAVSVLAVAVGVAAALLPALVAARRDPLTELRVP